VYHNDIIIHDLSFYFLFHTPQPIGQGSKGWHGVQGDEQKQLCGLIELLPQKLAMERSGAVWLFAIQSLAARGKFHARIVQLMD
jgi:hypothetical protein